jgi:hypothetical protein
MGGDTNFYDASNYALQLESLNLQQLGLDLQKKSSYLEGLGAVRDDEKDIADMKGSLAGYDIEIASSEAQVDSYDKWLANYSDMYKQQMTANQAEIESFKASGLESYENFMNAIGEQDAVSGATGRAGGAGLSQGAVTKKIDEKLVDYVGEDRTLDNSGGLYGTQLTAAEMGRQQLDKDLDFQLYEAAQNRLLIDKNYENTPLADLMRGEYADSLDGLRLDGFTSSLEGYNSAKNSMASAISNTTAAKGSLQEFIEANFGTNSIASGSTNSGAGGGLLGDAGNPHARFAS